MRHDFTVTKICPRSLGFDIEDGKISNVTFDGGCQGNLMGLGRLADGKDALEVARALARIPCGKKATSCPNELSKAIYKVVGKRPPKTATNTAVFADNPHGPAASGKADAGKAASDKSAVDKAPAGEISVGKSSSGKAPADKITAGKSAGGRAAADTEAAGKSAAGKAPADKQAAGKPAACKAPTGKESTGKKASIAPKA
ncbi:MAG: TIGR03905 family TSCPD domain-containing protein [Deltaproteobacteria bacterium]|jgi:uncharacterized protein (TIGR03905 family)|nr:TIGR03905 family TSCPD domain-containing protein [Deltaproteobacteria bacterium]